MMNYTSIVACIGRYTLLKLLARVQLAIPAWILPRTRLRCASECPDFNPEWPPYPTNKMKSWFTYRRFVW